MGIIDQKIAELAPARQFPVCAPPPELLANGIVVRAPNWLGDAVMTLPALQALKSLVPDHAPLAVIVPGKVADLYRLLPAVTHIISLDEVHRGWPEKIYRALEPFHFKVGVLFNNSLRDTLSLRRAGVTALYGRAARCRGIFLKRSFRFPRWRTGRLNCSHHANEYLSMVRALGAPVDRLVMPELICRRSMDQLRLEIQGFCQHPKLLVLAPGAAYGAAKRWPSEDFRAVARWHLDHCGIAVIVGGKEEKRIGDEVMQGLPANRIFNLCGQTDLADLYHLLKSAQACVANDSGIMHLAAALGTRGVAVFGPTDYCATGPVTDRWELVFEKECCAPCFHRVCPKGNPVCMTRISSETAIAALRRILPAAEDRKPTPEPSE